ncbi:MAG: hypothetical protein QOE28_2312, partial [Solirubrobacteraceae bacterium]|nr:hypothetical protein [Solirubrobacteraceae bacterium]
GSYFSGFGYSVERIFTESHPFDDPNGDFWTLWVNHKSSSTGVCGTELQEGDEVLFFVDRCSDPQPPDYACKNDPVLPLELRGAPAAATTGGSARLTVVRYDQQGNAAPVPGATVSGSGTDATTGSDGTATVAFPHAGNVVLKASKTGFARSEADGVAVSDASSSGTPAPTPTPVARDTTAPITKLLGLAEGRHYARSKAPRRLRGSVTPDPSGLQAVKLSLTRTSGGRCTLYSPTRERFRNARCGKRVYFKIGDRQDFDYLLPSRLAPGRYVLDAVAVDKAGNRDPIVRGRNRVVFFVR